MKYSEYVSTLNNYLNDLRVKTEVQTKTKLDYLGRLRGIDSNVLKQLGIIYVDNSTTLLHPKYLSSLHNLGLLDNLGKPIYHDRYIIPIYDINKFVVGLVGYSPTHKSRYVYATGKYYNRRNTPYGLHNIDYIVNKGYVILVEGITDAISLYNIGITNVLANCGTHRNKLLEDLVSRLEYGLIVIPDNDIAGEKAYNSWKFNTNKIKLKLSTAKDIAEYLKLNQKTNLVKSLELGEQYLKQGVSDIILKV